MLANEDNWMVVGKFRHLSVEDQKRRLETETTVDQALFNYLLETKGWDKLNLRIYYHISHRRQQWSKAHIP